MSDDTIKSKPDPATAMAELRQSARTVQLATVDADGLPRCSYTPFAFDEDGALLIFISDLSRHTGELLNQPRCSAMLIADEAASSEVYARLRVTWACRAEFIAREAPGWGERLARLKARQGKLVELLETLADFRLFRLVPESGLFVMGFGQAYQLHGQALDEFEHVREA